LESGCEGNAAPAAQVERIGRAAIGLGSVFLHLEAETNCHRLFHELIDDFDDKALAKRRAASLKAVGLPPPA